MNKDLHDNDDLFKAAYRQFEETPSPEVWDNVSAGLDKNDKMKKGRKFSAWLKTGSAILLLCALFIVFRLSNWKEERPSIKTPITQKLPVPGGDTKNNRDNPVLNSVAAKMESHKKESTKVFDYDNGLLTEQNPIWSSGKKPSYPIKKNIVIKAPDHKQTSDDAQPGVNNVTGSVSHKIGSVPDAIDIFFKRRMIGVLPVEDSNFGKPQMELLHIETLNKPPAVDESALTNIVKEHKTLKKNKAFIPYKILTAFASYDRANYKLDSDLPGAITSIKHREVHEPSFSAGILATQQLTTNWGLQTGIIYSYTAIGISPQKLFALKSPGNDIVFKYLMSSGYAYIKPGLGVATVIGDSLNTTEGKHTLQTISIPVMAKYLIGKSKFTISPGAGIEANFVTSARVETEIEHPLHPEIVFIDKLSGAKTLYFSLVADAEFRYRLNKRTFLNFRPAFRYALSPITKNNEVETFPFAFGAGVGAYYKILTGAYRYYRFPFIVMSRENIDGYLLRLMPSSTSNNMKCIRFNLA